MYDLNKMRAIGMLAARQAREKAAHEGTDANEVIDLTALLRPWAPGPQTAGEIVAQGNTPYRVLQSHDSTGNPDWTPENTPALFAPYHATDKAHALPWQAPTHAGDAYNAGEWMIYTDGLAYACTVDATVHGPDVLPGSWSAGEAV